MKALCFLDGKRRICVSCLIKEIEGRKDISVQLLLYRSDRVDSEGICRCGMRYGGIRQRGSIERLGEYMRKEKFNEGLTDMD